MSDESQTVRELRSDDEQMKIALELFRRGGGGGTSNGMEDRVARLEKAVETLQSGVTELRVDMATVKENLRHMPTKPWMFTILAATVTFMITLLTFIMAALIRFLPAAH